ncbi:MAG: hypothetical protein QME57_02405 [Patescibacteria group bacterium]|nr:hypothetical protein [Patescibacteria group bacterium]
MITNFRKSKKRVWPAIFFSIFLVFLAIGVIGFLVITNWKISQKRAKLQRKIEVLKREIQILEEKTASLRAGISQTEREDYLVKRAQEQGYFEKGAIPVIVLPTEEKTVKKEEEKNSWNPQTWWEWLKGKMRQ